MRHKPIILIAILLSSILVSRAQPGKLDFSKRFVESEDRWVAFIADSLGKHPYGFIYIDPVAGLTLDYAGTFSVDHTGKFIPAVKQLTSSTKVRLQPNRVQVAWIPAEKLPELNLTPQPDWLKNYKADLGSPGRLYRWGYLYNSYNECAKALEYLEAAQRLDPAHKGLSTELAYSYNCLGRFDKAIIVLEKEIARSPKDAYTNKELVFAQAHSGNLEAAEKTFRQALQRCDDKTYHPENAYNLLQGHYNRKDKANFQRLLVELEQMVAQKEQFRLALAKMKSEMK